MKKEFSWAILRSSSLAEFYRVMANADSAFDEGTTRLAIYGEVYSQYFGKNSVVAIENDLNANRLLE